VSARDLTPRESDILLLLADGLSNKEIARRLSISPDTVKDHLTRLYLKLSAHDRHHAVLQARALGLLPALAGAGAREGVGHG